MQTIDLTPTWGEIGTLYVRLAESGEVKALAGMRREVARAFAAAQALLAVQNDLPADLAERVRAVIRAEMTKQGYAADEAQPVADAPDA